MITIKKNDVIIEITSHDYENMTEEEYKAAKKQEEKEKKTEEKEEESKEYVTGMSGKDVDYLDSDYDAADKVESDLEDNSTTEVKESFTKIYTKDGKRVRYTDDENILKDWYNLIVLGIKKLPFASIEENDNIARVSIKVKKDRFNNDINKAFEFINKILTKSKEAVIKKYKNKAIENNQIDLSFRDKVTSDDDPEYFGFLYAIDAFVPYIDESALLEGKIDNLKDNASSIKSISPKFNLKKGINPDKTKNKRIESITSIDTNNNLYESNSKIAGCKVKMKLSIQQTTDSDFINNANIVIDMASKNYEKIYKTVFSYLTKWPEDAISEKACVIKCKDALLDAYLDDNEFYTFRVKLLLISSIKDHEKVIAGICVNSKTKNIEIRYWDKWPLNESINIKEEINNFKSIIDSLNVLKENGIDAKVDKEELKRRYQSLKEAITLEKSKAFNNQRS